MAVAPSVARPANHAVVRLISGPTVADSSHDRWLGLEFKLTPGWHVYWRNPGDAGSPPTATWTLPAAWSLGAIQWPRPRRIEVPPLTAFGYEERVVFPIRFSSRGGDRGIIRGHVSWVACRLECVAEDDSVMLVLTPAEPTSGRDERVVADAVDRLPTTTPAGWTMRGESVGTSIVLSVHAPFGDDVRVLDFFPADPGVVEHSARVTSTVKRDRITLRLVRSQYANALPERITGLVVLTGRDSIIRSYDVEFPIGAAASGGDATRRAASANWATLLLLAFASGLLVNVMPCVFPLLGIKALSLSSTVTRPSERSLRALAYAAGSIASSALIGGILLLSSDPARSAWGFQMQSPSFLGGVALLLFGAGLSLLGVFEVPALFPRWLGARTDGLTASVGSFAAGATAILIGAPCAAPFFGVTLAGALTAPHAVGFAAFVSFGLGAAAPFAMLVVTPASIAWIPRSGRWMETAKQLLAFPLFGATAWLVWVAQLQTGSSGSAALLASLCAVAFALWMLGRWATVSASPSVRRAALAASAVVAGVAIVSVSRLTVSSRAPANTSSTGLHWQAYTDARLDSLLSASRAVLVDFTAEWCLTCKVNEIGTLQSERVVSVLRERSVGLLRANLTVADTSITRALHAVGGASLPTYALFAAAERGSPRLLPILLTPDIVVSAVERATAASRTTVLESPR